MAVSYKITSLTKHFSLKEYSVNQTTRVVITYESLIHAACLEEFRVWLGRAMKIMHGIVQRTIIKKLEALQHLRIFVVVQLIGAIQTCQKTTLFVMRKSGGQFVRRMALSVKQVFISGVCT